MKVKKSLKKKFAQSISILILLIVISIGGILTIQAKKQIESDIFFQVRSLAELTAPEISTSAENFLLKDNSIPFERTITETLSKLPDVYSIEVYSFDNTKLYQSSDIVTEADLGRVQANLPSVQTQSDQVYFLKKEAAGQFMYVNQNLNPIPQEELEKHIVIKNIYYPVDQKNTVIYRVNYDNLQKRLISQGVTLLAILCAALAISVLVAYILSLVVTKPILKLNTTVKEIASGNFDKRVQIKSQDEVGELAGSVNQMAEDLTKAVEAKVYKSRVEKELELAKKIQENLLPKSIPEVKGLDISGTVIPATEIGGDVYDTLTDESGNLLTYVGDVTGHGVPAGILSAISNSIIVSLHEDKLITIANTLNKILKTKATPNMFITAAFARYQPTKPNNLTYLSAGHEQLIHYKANTQKAEMLPSGGIALGMFPDVSKLLKDQIVEDFEPGDIIIMYSDGIPEAWKNEEETYGFDRLVETLEKSAKSSESSSAEQIKESILADIHNFTGDYEQKDDITLLVLKRG
jgi:serine phosphatase RsbU (regulator of sigma subunit)